MFRARAIVVILFLLAAAAGQGLAGQLPPAEGAAEEPRVRQALFVVAEGVYNSELMAPFDVLQHTVFRDQSDYVRTAIVSAEGGSVVTFEGITVEAHYSFADAPKVDILVIPSTKGSMSDDLADEAYMGWVRRAAEEAEWVITVCDGAFPLAATGALDGRVATTYPGDRDQLAQRFPEVDVRHNVRLVVDGKFITSVGGGMSYEPAFWLVEKLYGSEHAEATAVGLVWPWDLETVPHLVVGAQQEPADEAAVRHVIGEYVAGWRAGDVARLGAVFELDHGYIIWDQAEDGESTIRSRTFGELLERRKPNPGYGEPFEILDLDVHEGKLAFATVRVERAPRGSYIDHFTLHKVAGEWRITTKTFVWRPAEVPDEVADEGQAAE